MDNEKFQGLVLEKLNMLTDEVKGVKSTVSKLEIRIENEVIEKIRGLYDDREVQNNRFDRTESKLDDISTDVGYIAAKNCFKYLYRSFLLFQKPSRNLSRT